MEALRQYVISVTACAILCGIVIGLTGKGISRELVRLIGGLFLAFTIMQPIAQLDFSEIFDRSFSFSMDAAAVSAMGEEMAAEAIRDIIKSETEAYILDKAAALNACVEAEVTVSEGSPPVPAKVRISGKISPYAKQQLENVLTGELGISKEKLLWIG